jgi:hypothetical protein
MTEQLQNLREGYLDAAAQVVVSLESESDEKVVVLQQQRNYYEWGWIEILLSPGFHYQKEFHLEWSTIFAFVSCKVHSRIP